MKVDPDTIQALTGIEGFDEVSRGGLPRGSVTLVTGGAGSGKTVFGLQTLVGGASLFDEPGLFVAFEENSRKIRANAASFGWPSSGWEILDAMPPSDVVSIGEFDLSGLLAVLSAKVRAMKARRIVFDSLDVLLNLLPGVAERRREINRLHAWLHADELTAIITAKLDWVEYALPLEDKALQYLPFIVDCVVALTHDAEHGFSRRRLRIIKYRGSNFFENDTPFVIGPRGLDLLTAVPLINSFAPSNDKVSTGVHALDEMLYGGFLRGSTTMITGIPGTAKTTLAGAFVEAAAKRGEHALFVTFDEGGEEIVRNLRSVSIDLQTHVDKGLLQMHSDNAVALGAEELFHRIKALVMCHQATCLVIDPFTAFSSAGSLADTQAIAARLVRWVKSKGITLVCTSLPTPGEVGFSGTVLKITTVADTWIYLSFSDSGERNRGLTILKSRGTNHSNQLRELILSSSGISIADPYTAGGVVLMGTLRWQKERAEAEERERLTSEFERQAAAVDDELERLETTVRTLQDSIVEKRLARGLRHSAELLRRQEEANRQSGMIRLRQSGELGSSEESRPRVTPKLEVGGH
jgi:circadian clock protein KaiC